MNTKDKPNIFSLTQAEKKAFSSLSVDQANLPAQLVRKTRLPRTTLLRTLDALARRGLAESHTQGKRLVWRRAPQGSIERSILASTKSLGVSVADMSVPGFTLIRGADDLTRTLRALLESLPRNGRFTGVQPTISALAAMEKMGLQETIKINELIKQRGIIVQGVLEENFVGRLSGVYGREWFKSFAGRLAHTSVVPEEYLRYLSDLYIIGNHAMLANWQDEIGVVIGNKDVVALLNSLFKFMHDSGRRMDIPTKLFKTE